MSLSVHDARTIILCYLNLRKQGQVEYINRIQAVPVENYESIAYIEGEISKAKRAIGLLSMLEHQCTERVCGEIMHALDTLATGENHAGIEQSDTQLRLSTTECGQTARAGVQHACGPIPASD